MVQWKNFASVTCIQSLYFGEKLSSAVIHVFALSFQTEYCSQIFVYVYYVAFGFVRSLTLPFLSFFFLPVVVKSWSSKNQNFNTWGQETVERQVLLGWCDWGLKGWHFYILCTTFIFRCVNKKKHMETHTQTCPCYHYSMLTVWFLLSLTLQYSFKLSFKRHKHFEAGCTVFHCT